MKTGISLFLLGIFHSLVSFGQTSGGPDNFGYMWYGSDDPNGPVYNWIDISTVGSPVSGLTDDNSTAAYSMTDFVYYGQTVNEIILGSNGWLSFESGNSLTHCFPSIPEAGGQADHYLAPFTTDLIFVEIGSPPNPAEAYVYEDLANNRFIISYLNVPYWANNNPGYVGSNSFQVILSRADSSITFQYNTTDPGNFPNLSQCATDIVIGIENASGSDGLLHSADVVPPGNYAIRFEYPTCPNFNYATTQTGATITAANAPGTATYQWLDCGNNFAVINGETGQSFTATSNGDYAVEITNGGCVDTTACVSITTASIVENAGINQGVQVTPNPSDGVFTVNFNEFQENVVLKVRDITGKQIRCIRQNSVSSVPLVLNEPGGVYFLEVINAQGRLITHRIVKR